MQYTPHVGMLRLEPDLEGRLSKLPAPYAELSREPRLKVPPNFLRWLELFPVCSPSYAFSSSFSLGP